MKLLSLRLKNFKGIKFGSLGLDEINIDFSSLPDGMIAITGLTGAGKTTILDNMPPYRVMPYRDSQSLVDAVYDIGEKENVYQMPDGTLYKTFLKINAKARQMDSYLSRYNPEKQQWDDPIVDGRNEEFDREVERIFMPQKLFYIADYRAQDATSFISYKKSDWKAMFEQMIGLDYLLEKSQKAKKQREEGESLLRIKAAEIERIRKNIDLLVIERPDPGVTKLFVEDVAAKEREVAAVSAEISSLTSEKSVLAEKETGLATRQKEALDSVEAALKVHVDSLESLKKKEKQYAEAVGDRENILMAESELKTARIAEAAKKDEARKRAQSVDRRSKTAATLAKLKEKLSAEKDKLTKASSQAKLLEEVPCGDDEKKTCKLLALAVAAKNGIPGNMQKIDDLESEIQDAENYIGHIDSEIAGLAVEVPAELTEKIERLQALTARKEVLANAERELAVVREDIRRTKDTIAKVTDSQGEKVEAFKKEIAAVAKRTEEVAAALTDRETRKGDLDVALASIREKLEDVRVKERTAEENARQKVVLEKDIVDLEAEVDAIRGETAQWALIEKGFGRDGLIALELEVASPEISNIINSLLNEMGGRFAVRFETLRPKASKKNEYIETFDIRVLDTEAGVEKSLIDLSGGERVVVDDAIARGVGIYVAKTAGANVKTLFSDERDGALDKTKKLEYCAMKRQVLKLGGYRQEFFISHTPELWDLADATINVSSRGIEIDLHSAASTEMSVVAPAVVEQERKVRRAKRSQTDDGAPSPKKGRTKKKSVHGAGETANPEMAGEQAAAGPTLF